MSYMAMKPAAFFQKPSSYANSGLETWFYIWKQESNSQNIINVNKYNRIQLSRH